MVNALGRWTYPAGGQYVEPKNRRNHALKPLILGQKADWSRGLFVSISGFSSDGLEAFGRAKRIVYGWV